MPRTPHRRRRRRAASASLAAVTRAKAGIAPALTALAAACADVAPPVTAPQPRASVDCPGWDLCGEPVDPTPSSRKLHVVAARGPNKDGSFTTVRGERTVTLTADALPSESAPQVRWTVSAAPAAGVLPAVATPLASGASAAADVPAQSAARWRLPHGAPLSARALAFYAVAELPGDLWQSALRDSVVVQQREVDVLRQEYADFGIPVPAASDVREAGDVAGATRFSWGQLNQGDYKVAVLSPRLIAGLNAFDALSGRTLVVTSVFRNPAHHRYHVSVSGGFATALRSEHQYGNAVDVSTGRDKARWDELHAWAKQLGACAEPLRIATVNHVHADWRPAAPVCPPGW